MQTKLSYFLIKKTVKRLQCGSLYTEYDYVEELYRYDKRNRLTEYTKAEQHIHSAMTMQEILSKIIGRSMSMMHLIVTLR